MHYKMLSCINGWNTENILLKNGCRFILTRNEETVKDLISECYTIHSWYETVYCIGCFLYNDGPLMSITRKRLQTWHRNSRVYFCQYKLLCSFYFRSIYYVCLQYTIFTLFLCYWRKLTVYCLITRYWQYENESGVRTMAAGKKKAIFTAKMWRDFEI